MRKKVSREHLIPLLFHAPTFLTLTAITMFPLLYNVYTSLHGYRLAVPGSERQFVGLANYARILEDREFWNSVGVTFKFVLGVTVAQLVLGFLVALALNSITRGRRILTSLVMIPMMVAPLVVGLMFSFTLNPQFGLYSYLVDRLGLALPQAPLSSAGSALIVMMITDIWEWTPFMVLMILAALQSVPIEPIEAAMIDGASEVQTLRYVTLPLIRPVVVVAVVLRAIEAFKEFDKPYILTGGGPGAATEVIDMFTYREAFVNFNFSYASALSIVLFVVLLAAGIGYWRLVMEGRK
ncbi:MAG: sugar ABC transporter permease [Bacillota bacterium]